MKWIKWILLLPVLPVIIAWKLSAGTQLKTNNGMFCDKNDPFSGYKETTHSGCFARLVGFVLILGAELAGIVWIIEKIVR